jgi:hypothetical protein
MVTLSIWHPIDFRETLQYLLYRGAATPAPNPSLLGKAHEHLKQTLTPSRGNSCTNNPDDFRPASTYIPFYVKDEGKLKINFVRVQPRSQKIVSLLIQPKHNAPFPFFSKDLQFHRIGLHLKENLSFGDDNDCHHQSRRAYRA